MTGVNWRREVRFYVPLIDGGYASAGAIATAVVVVMPDSSGVITTPSFPPGRAQVRIDGNSYDFDIPSSATPVALAPLLGLSIDYPPPVVQEAQEYAMAAASSALSAVATNIPPRTDSVTSSPTPTINTDDVDMFGITGLTVDITSMSANLSGTPVDGQMLWLYFIGIGPNRTITWGASFEAGAAKLPLTVLNARLDVALVWNVATNKWRCMDSSEPYPAFATITSSATPSINTDIYDAFSITALAVTITSMSTNLTGTPRNFQQLMIRIKDNGTFRPISWGVKFQDGAVALPTVTVPNKTLLVGLVYDAVDSKWTCEASGSRP